MQIVMLHNVTPEEYGLTGQWGWADSVQWEKGEILNASNFDNPELMHHFVSNGDAKYLEEETHE